MSIKSILHKAHIEDLWWHKEIWKMEKNKIRLLKPNEIECRVGMAGEKGISLLLYKDARVDMKILDEVYGPNNWKREHQMIGNNLYCIVSVWDDKKEQWISKMDVGSKSNTEQEKGEASDSFKRACVSLGIGRELYTAPFIWLSREKVNIAQKNGKYNTYDKFKVKSISYNEDREITGLCIQNQNGIDVYKLLESGSTTVDEITKPTKNSNDERVDEINRELIRTGVALDTVLARYGVNSVDEMDEIVYRKAINGLKRTKPIAA